MSDRSRWAAALLVGALALSAHAEPPADPGRPVLPVTPRPSFPSLPPPSAGAPDGPVPDAGNRDYRPPGYPRIDPGNAGARPEAPPLEVAPPPAAPQRPNPARESLLDKRDRERCATGEILRDRHGRPCP